MSEMTTYERMRCMYEHEEADRVPVTDDPWSSTLERWHREGMPEDVSFEDYFGLDRFATIDVDNSPRYPEQVVERTAEYVVQKTRWGTTLRNWAHAGGVPEFLHHTIVDPASWAEAKARMTLIRTACRGRCSSRTSGAGATKDAGSAPGSGSASTPPIPGSWAPNALLVALVEQPEWSSTCSTTASTSTWPCSTMVWDAGYHFDAITWCDDMGYKGTQFFSRAHVPRVAQARAQAGHRLGARPRHQGPPALLRQHQPLRARADRDRPGRAQPAGGEGRHGPGGPQAGVRRPAGPSTAASTPCCGTEPERIEAEMRRVVPAMKQNGGYIFTSDHSVPRLGEPGELPRASSSWPRSSDGIDDCASAGACCPRK